MLDESATHQNATAPAEGATLPWRWFDPVAIFLLSTVTGAFVGSIAIRSMTGDIQIATVLLIGASSTGGWTILWARIRLGRRAFGRTLKPDDLRGDLIAGLGAGIFAVGLSTLVVVPIVTWIAASVTGAPVDPPRQLDFSAPDGAVLAVAAIAAVVVAPISEELFYRGVLFSAFRRRAGRWVSALASAAIWAALHVHPLVIPSIFAFGIILGQLFERRASIVAPITAHILFNIVGFATYTVTLGQP